MERRIRPLTARRAVLRWCLAAAGAACLLTGAVAQVPSQRERIRIQIWAELDAFPGSFDDDDGARSRSEAPAPERGTDAAAPSSPPSGAQAHTVPQAEAEGNANRFTSSARSRDISVFEFAIRRAREISPFLLAGMLDGWTFDYVPADKARNVEEFYEFGQVKSFDSRVNRVYYRDPVVEDGRLLCWASCDRTPGQQLNFERWQSIIHPKVRGHGTGRVEDGFEGIQAACAAAVKDAVRKYWRIYTKNKPKEISGTVLLIQEPRIYISEGQYVVDLDFFLETDRIVVYSYY